MMWVRFSPRAHLYRGVAQPGSASGLGPEGRRFESCHPDQGEVMIRDLFVTVACYATGIVLIAAIVAVPFFIRDDV